MVVIGFILRASGLLLFAAGFVALVADGVRSLAVDAIVLTPLLKAWTEIDPSGPAAAEALVKSRLEPYLWDHGIVPILGWPGFAVIGGLGILLLLLGRRRRPGPVR